MFREGAPTRWEGRQVGVREGGGFESWGAKSWFLGWGIFAISPLSIVRLFGIVGGVGNEWPIQEPFTVDGMGVTVMHPLPCAHRVGIR